MSIKIKTINCPTIEKVGMNWLFMVGVKEGETKVLLGTYNTPGKQFELSIQDLYGISRELHEIAFQLDPRNEAVIAATDAIKRGESVSFIPTPEGQNTGVLNFDTK